jgi:hypothetical protein
LGLKETVDQFEALVEENQETLFPEETVGAS